jgi:hypothetical protein
MLSINIFWCVTVSPVPVTEQSRMRMYGHLLAGIVGLLLTGDRCMSLVSVVCCQVEVPVMG